MRTHTPIPVLASVLCLTQNVLTIVSFLVRTSNQESGEKLCAHLLVNKNKQSVTKKAPGCQICTDQTRRSIYHRRLAVPSQNIG